MSQAPVTVNELIVEAYTIAGKLGADEVLQSYAVTDGLSKLNRILAGYSGNVNYISLSKTIEFSTIANKDTYVLSNVATVNADIVGNRAVVNGLQNAWFTLNDAQYPLTILTDTQFYGTYRYTAFSSLPACLIVSNEEERTALKLYPIPNQIVQVFIRGKFYLDDFVLNTPIRNVPRPIYDFLTFELAFRLLARGENLSQTQMMIYEGLKSQVITNNDLDFTAKSSPLLQYPRNYSRYNWYNGGFG